MLLIFSDLDATLLDHNTYSFQEALPALQLIRKRKIPLILSSSKTYDEMIVIRKELNNHDPFIYENGSGIYFEDNKVSLGTSHSEISNLLQDLKKRFSFTSFNDLGPEGIQKETGLDIYASERAYRREFTEPLIWKDSTQNLIIFKQLLQQNNLTAAQGGRFLTISSPKNKGDALLWVKKRYESIAKVKITTIGLGDSENDINMLDCADNAIIVRHPKKLPPNINGHASLIITDAIGPKGWNEAIINILDEQ
jgi:mannosyl-3-phosphoglycerate phosphatase